jgi:hypothetical protein
MFQKILLVIILNIFFFISSAQSYTLKAGISIDKVPKELYGSWRVKSKLLSCNNDSLFNQSSVDIWNLSKAKNVITLDNPFSGAHAFIIVDEVKNNLIKFKKISNYDNSQKLTDTVELILDKNTFTGINKLKIDTISQIDNHVIKSDIATYKLSGEKISGDSLQINNQK